VSNIDEELFNEKSDSFVPLDAKGEEKIDFYK